ncbi:MAG: chromosomal replication initiator protein DnaA [Thermodesulfobacteriota bacterium]
MNATWQQIKETLKLRLPDHSYRMWIEPLECDRLQDGQIRLLSPNLFQKKRVQENFGDILEDVIHTVTGNHCELSVVVPEKQHRTETARPAEKGKDNPPGMYRPESQQELPAFAFRPHSGRMLRKDFTFDNFVVGGNNDFAYTASLSLATQKSSTQKSLFLLSNTGLGKSHLSQAVGHQILADRPLDRVYYITAEDFAMEMVHAFRHDAIDKFKEKYRTQCDVLLLEDIHFLTGKERTQIELAQALDYLLEANKKIIFTSCYAPGEIPKLSEQLRSRLSCGLISNIDPPGFSTRVRILRTKAKKNGHQIPSEVIEYLAGELSENVRQLESGLFGVIAKSSLLGAPYSLELAESVVKNIVRQKMTITVDIIKALVCKNFSISIKDIVSKSRKQQIVRPRQIAIFLARRYTDQPLQVIGKYFNRQHATAIHAITAVENALKNGNGPVKKQVEYLCQKLETGNF